MKWNASTAGLRPTRHQAGNSIVRGGSRRLAPGAGVTGAPPQIVVVQHFDEELKRLVPVK